MATADTDGDTLGHDLRMAIGRLGRRLRQMYAGSDATGRSSFLETAVLSRLNRDRPTTPGALAAEEGVSAQAVGSVVTALAARGLIRRTRDPSDGRRAIVTITADGRRRLEQHGEVISARISRTIAEEFTSADRRQLAEIVPLLERLVEAL